MIGSQVLEILITIKIYLVLKILIISKHERFNNEWN